MRWIVSLSVVLVAGAVACGGPQIPTHNGYKPKETKPWKKPKPLKLDDKGETKVEADVSYPDMRRAKWYQLDLPSNGQLSLALEITPPGDAVNDDFDLGMEVLDPSFHVVSKSDLEDEDAHELTKKKTLVDLAPGKYLVHIYLEGRMDSADFVLRAAFKSTAAAEARTNFPADVPFVPSLAMIPLQDDTPKGRMPTVTVTRKPRPQPAAPPPPTTKITAHVIAIQVVSKGTLITVDRGTETGASETMKVTLTGLGATQLSKCNARTCTALIERATPDQVKNAGAATLSQ